MSKATEILNKLNEEGIKVTFRDVLDAKERYEQQIKDTTWLIERIKVYGSKEIQQRAYNNVTAQLKAMDSFSRNVQSICVVSHSVVSDPLRPHEL